MRIGLAGTNGPASQIQTSIDLQSWTNWGQILNSASGSVEIGSASTRLFFRAMLVPATSAAGMTPEAALGRRLFRETRFAQYFAANCENQINAPLRKGDPVLDQTVTMTAPLPGSFAGGSMSCRVCHMLDEESGAGWRAYADFAIRSPIPERGDNRTATLRNAPALINASIPRPGEFFLHYDGEFPDGASLVEGTLTGRNFGWLSTEKAAAVGHIARVVREDDGSGFGEGGLSYRELFHGSETPSGADAPLSEAYRLDVAKASDDDILQALSGLVEAYLRSLRFRVNQAGEYEGSPYDLFLRKNGLPARPNPDENDLAYSRRLRGLLQSLSSPAFVTAADGGFQSLSQTFSFGARELEGLKMFLAEPDATTTVERGKVGNCLACHAAPHFTDFSFHNTGATQWEYDSVHGEGAFSSIAVPSLAERQAAPLEFLPPTSAHPNASGRFFAAPDEGRPGFVDLGLWNVYANDDFGPVQPALQRLLASRFGAAQPTEMLPRTVALFKTPGLRGLSFSAPYLHTGQASTLEALIFFYRFTSDLARDKAVRNVDPDIGRIFLTKDNTPALAAFLRSLNEDLVE